jgi:hypothetical protein
MSIIIVNQVLCVLLLFVRSVLAILLQMKRPADDLIDDFCSMQIPRDQKIEKPFCRVIFQKYAFCCYVCPGAETHSGKAVE